MTTLKKNLFISAVILISLTLLIVSAEVLFRLFLLKSDANGILSYKTTILKPYRFPLKDFDLYKKQTNYKWMYCYDKDLGWILQPGYRSSIYQFNSKGMRSGSKEYDLKPKDNILRIGLFGDSFIVSDDEPFDRSLGYYLENDLNARGVKVEVLNFGVGGYGMDQAYLRWQKTGIKYNLDLVIFGFQAENVKRNLNIFRALYSHGSFPFSKPRFILRSGKLQVINSPTLSTRDIGKIFEAGGLARLKQHEFFYSKSQYQNRLLYLFKFGSYLYERIINCKYLNAYIERPFYKLKEEPSQLALKIVDVFKRDVEKSGANFLVVHLPKHVDLFTLESGSTLPYQELLREIVTKTEAILPEQQMIKRLRYIPDSNLKYLFNFSLHYSGEANEIIAEIISDHLQNKKYATVRLRKNIAKVQ